jgi:cell division protein FtsL
MEVIGIEGRPRRRRDEKKTRRLFRTIGLLVLFFSIVFFYLWEQVEIVKLGSRIDELTRKRERLLEEKRRLSLERAFFTSPLKVEEFARIKLGMRYPKPEEVVVINPAETKRGN